MFGYGEFCNLWLIVEYLIYMFILINLIFGLLDMWDDLNKIIYKLF